SRWFPAVSSQLAHTRIRVTHHGAEDAVVVEPRHVSVQMRLPPRVVERLPPQVTAARRPVLPGCGAPPRVPSRRSTDGSTRGTRRRAVATRHLSSQPDGWPRAPPP